VNDFPGCEHGGCRHAIEAERIASCLLRKGDIVATDRGFFMFRGLAPDGITNDFVPVANPLGMNRK
jgi:hypothetical protein